MRFSKSSKRLSKSAIIGIVLTAVAVALVGGTLAYLITGTDSITNTFAPSKVQCEVTESWSNNVKSDIKVSNIGEVDAFFRVKLVHYWVDAEGKQIGIDSWDIPNLPLGNDWELGNDGFYYYKKSVAPNGSTATALFTGSITLSSQTDEKGDVIRQSLDVFAEAIQSSPNEAVADSWTNDKCTVSASNGTLTLTAKTN